MLQLLLPPDRHLARALRSAFAFESPPPVPYPLSPIATAMQALANEATSRHLLPPCSRQEPDAPRMAAALLTSEAQPT